RRVDGLVEIEWLTERHHVAIVGSLGNREEQSRVVHRPRERPEVLDRVELRRQEVERDPPEARLQPDQPAPGSRNADRPAHVRALSRWTATRGDGCTRATGRAARRAALVPRVPRDAPEWALREARIGELRRRRLPDHDRAGRDETLDEQRAGLGNPVLVG